MKSTGEVMGVADNFGEAFAKAQMAAGQMLPTSGTVFISANDRDKPFMPELAQRFVELGFSIVATHGTAGVLEGAGLRVERVYKVKEGRPNVVDLIKGERIQLIINTPHGVEPWFDEKAIRRAAVMARIPTITTLSAARAACEGIAALQRGEAKVYALQQLHAERSGREVALRFTCCQAAVLLPFNQQFWMDPKKRKKAQWLGPCCGEIRPLEVYCPRLAGGMMLFIRRYSTICP